VSIPARAYQVGIEEFVLRFIGDTFSFSVELSEHGLEALHDFARMQHTMAEGDELMPLGTSFGGVQLLDMFLRQLLPLPQNERPKSGLGIMGLSGPDGRAISFYPTMPVGFNKTAESNEYTFTLTMPAKIDSAAEIKKLEKKLVANPTDAELYFGLATVYLYEGRLQDVIRCLTTAIQKAPPHANVHGLMGQTLRKLGRFDEALVHCEKAAALEPEDARIQTELGICLGELGKHDAALGHFEAAARIEPSSAGYQVNLCMALISLNRSSEAIVAARGAVNLDPKNEKSAMLLGILLDKEGSSAEATGYLEKATELSPGSAKAHEQLGIHSATTGQHEKAVVSFKKAIELEESPRRLELLGASFAGLGDWSEAEEAFRRGVTLAPNHSNMRSNLGVALVHLGRIAEAAEMFEEVLRRSPNNARTERMLAELRRQLEA
jgi:Flp pilus assembly protein TadD